MLCLRLKCQVLGEAASKGQSLPLGAGESAAPKLYVSPLYENRRIFLTRVR